MEESIAAAVFGNVGSILSFQVGADDGEVLAEQLGGDVEASDVMSLPKYTAYIRLLVDGLAQRPFSMDTIPPKRAKRGGSSRNNSATIPESLFESACSC